MTKPETKVVLGRRFTKHTDPTCWKCVTKFGELVLYDTFAKWTATLERPEHCDNGYCVESSTGPTEADAILALQSQLRKMAELEAP